MLSYIIKTICLILVILSLPLYKKLTLPVILGFLYIVILFIAYLWAERKIRKTLQQDATSNFTLEILRPWLQLILISISIYIFLKVVIYSGIESSIWIVIILCWILPLVGLYIVIRNVLTIISTARSLTEIRYKHSKILNYIMYSGALLFALVGPYIIFAYGYDLFFTVLLDKKIGSKFDAFYLSLTLANVLPANNSDYTDLISDVNKNSYLTYFHVFQVFFIRIFEGILLVAIFNAVIGIFKISKAD